MADIERLTITLPSDMAATVKNAVAGGNYASSSEVVCEALRDWMVKTELRRHKLDALRCDIDEGLQDIREGRISDFNVDDILAEGRRLSATRDPSA